MVLQEQSSIFKHVTAGHHVWHRNLLRYSSGWAGTAPPTYTASPAVEVSPGDYFEPIDRETPGSTENVVANQLTWSAIEVVEQVGLPASS
jgi:hypothetical protein